MATTLPIPQKHLKAAGISLPGRVTVVHSGARDAYQVALALEEAGLLDTLVTDLYWPADRAWAQRLFSHLPQSWQALLRPRFSLHLPSSKVQSRSLTGLATLLVDKSSLVPQALRRTMMRRTDAVLGRTARRIAERNHSALLSYSYYAHDAFTGFNGERVLFQLHPHPASMRRILREELAANPQCAASLLQEWELALPESDFEHLVNETTLADRILVASSFTRDTLIEHGSPADMIRVIPYGVDITHFSPDAARTSSHNKKLRLLFVGRINQRKGIQYLLDALRLLNSDQVELTVCGRVVDDLEIFRSHPNVRVRPDVSSTELLAAYQQADLFVFPSVAEGFGQVLLEALACGLPILSTTRTAAPDLIESGHQGFVIEPCRADQIATHIEWAITHRHSLAQMRAAARHTAEYFTWKRFRTSVACAIANDTNQNLVAEQRPDRRNIHAL